MAGRIELAVFGHTTRDFIVTYDGRLQLGYLGGGGMNAAAGASYWAKDGEVGLVTRRPPPCPPPCSNRWPGIPASTSRGCG